MKLPKITNRFHRFIFAFGIFTILLILCLNSIDQIHAESDDPPEEYRDDTSEEFNIQEESFGIAWGDPDGEHSIYAWPYDFDQMGLVMQSYQNYSSGISSAYFHHGMDMVAPDGTHVYTRSGGQVVNIENYNPGNDLYWEVAILDGEGYVWQYHHIDKNTIPQLIHDKFDEWQSNPSSGGYVPPNTHIGDIIYWPVVSLGYRFNHIHLNILGAGDVYINPLEFHTMKDDTQMPEILEIGLLDGDTIISGNTTSGEYGMYVRARDLFMSPVYYLPPFKTEFSIDGGEWVTVWEFHTMPGGSSDTAFVNDFFVPYYTEGDYEDRDFYIDLGFTPEGQRSFPDQPGPHTIDVRVWDYYGNSTTSSFDWNVEIRYENIVPQTIPDNGCSSGNFVTTTFDVSENFFVKGVNLGLNISHSYRGDVQVYLQSPSITEPVQIVIDTNDRNDNYDVLLTDLSSNPLNDNNSDNTSSPYYDREASPNLAGSLDGFLDHQSSGTWTVYVCDNRSGTTGTLNRVLLELIPPNPTVTNVINFGGTRQEGGNLLSWETTDEKDIYGFNLYRFEKSEGYGEVINSEVILSHSITGTNDPFYFYLDDAIDANINYYYWLEVLDFSMQRKDILGSIQVGSNYQCFFPVIIVK